MDHRGLIGSKIGITYLHGAYAVGSDKLPTLIIGHSKRPQLFNRRVASYWGFDCKFNTEAWMTAVIFSDWLTSLNTHMHVLDKKILLLLENFSGHTSAVKLLSLSHITVKFLPPNTTSVL